MWDGLNATGNILGTLNLVAQGSSFVGCTNPGDPSGILNCWAPVGLAFSETARSVEVSGTPNTFAFDDVTFESAFPSLEPSPVPAVGHWGQLALFAALLLAAGIVGPKLRRRRAA